MENRQKTIVISIAHNEERELRNLSLTDLTELKDKEKYE